MITPATLAPTPNTDELGLLLEHARTFADAAHAPNTRRAYGAQWRSFVAWCGALRLRPLPAAADTIALYVAALDREGLVPASVDVALAAIAKMHQAHALESPCTAPAVAAVRAGLRRTRGTVPRQAAPLRIDELLAVVGAIGADLLGLRDRALLLLGWCSAVRRSDLVAIDVPELVFTGDGAEVFLRRSKTDQEGEGFWIGVPFALDPAACPVRAVRAWVDAAGITAGPVFRPLRGRRVLDRRLSDRAVARVVQARATAAGLDASRLSGHSLRAGFVTSAARAGRSERAIMDQTGHRSLKIVRRYIRRATLFEENAAAGLL